MSEKKISDELEYGVEISKEDEDVIVNFIRECENNEEYEPTVEELEVLDKYGILDEVLGEVELEEEKSEAKSDECKGVYVETEELEGCSLDHDEYIKGLEEASYFVGFISALKSIDYPTKYIHELILNAQSCDSNIKVARQSMINVEKNSI